MPVLYCLPLCLTEIDQEGVIAADTDPAQEMGDESIEVFCLLLNLCSVCKVVSVIGVLLDDK